MSWEIFTGTGVPRPTAGRHAWEALPKLPPWRPGFRETPEPGAGAQASGGAEAAREAEDPEVGAPLFPHHQQGANADGALATGEVGWRHQGPLGDTLALARALRSFKSVREPGRPILDIEATVAATADAHALVLVSRPTARRRLDVALVVDSSPSVAVWADAFTRLAAVLRQVGAFRSVSRWDLVLRPDSSSPRVVGDEVVSVGASAPRPSLDRFPDEDRAVVRDQRGHEHDADRIIDPSGRRLVLLATDAVSDRWYGRRCWGVAERWAKSMPVAVLQTLPEHYWPDTALGDELVAARARWPASPNGELATRIPWWVDDLAASGRNSASAVPLPVIPVTPDGLERWAHAIVGGLGWVPAIFGGGVTELPAVANVGVSARDRVRAFRRRASPAAARLAEMLAGAPLLSLDLMHLLRASMTPPAGVTELAEVLVGGLLEAELVEPGVQAGLYRFRPGVSDLLRHGVSAFQDWRTYDLVTERFGRPDQSGDDVLRALVLDPDGSARLDPAVRPFAELWSSLAARLGLAVNPAGGQVVRGPGRDAEPAEPDGFGSASGAVHGVVIALDAEVHGAGGLGAHFALRRDLTEIFQSALAHAGIESAPPQNQDRGDGFLVVVASTVPAERIVRDFVDRLRAALRLYNQERLDVQGRIRLRLALHEGRVLPDATGWAGRPIVDCSRLLDAALLRAALREDPDVDLVLIVSDVLYESVIKEGLAGIDPRAYRKVEVLNVEKNFRVVAWLSVPERGNGSVALNGPRERTVQGALLSAFPSRNELEMLVGRLGRRLSDYAAEAVPLPDAVFLLVRAAQAQNWLGELIGEAFRTTPDNADLAAVRSGFPELGEPSTPVGFVASEAAAPANQWFPPSSQTPFPATILFLDAVGYSRRGMLVQLATQDGLREISEAAFARVGIDLAAVRSQDRGGGYLAVISPFVTKAALAADFVRELGTALAERNRTRNAEGRIRLRLSLHHGDVLPSATGWGGDAVVTGARLVDSPPVRTALAHNLDADLALIVSSTLFDGVIRERLRGLDPDSFQEVEVDMEKFHGRAWLTLPGDKRGARPTAGEMPSRDDSFAAENDKAIARTPAVGERPDIVNWDFFVSVVADDEAWGSWIAWYLEEQGYRVHLETWDLQAGNFAPALLDDVTSFAKRTIVVLSPAYVRSDTVNAAWREAWLRDPGGLRRTLVPVRVEDCTPEGPLRGIFYIDLVGLDQEAARERLNEQIRRAVAGSYRPTNPPTFPGAR
jgi:hypothetical protein